MAIPSYSVYVIVLIAALVVLFFLGPKETIKQDLLSNKIPDDIDKYILSQESKIAHLVPGAEKKLIWRDEHKKQVTEYSLIYLHGFSASRQEVSPLVENLAEKLGTNVFLTRLTGHGQDNDAMSDITVNALFNDTLEAWEVGKRIGRKVIVVANSTGATLATWLAAQKNTENLSALILMSPNYGLKNKKSEWLLLPWAKYFIPLLEGDTYHFQPDNDLQARYWTWQYSNRALFPMMALVDYVRKQDFNAINVPVQVLYSEDDNVIDVAKIKSLYPQFGSKIKQIQVISGTEGSQHHILAGEIMTPGTTFEVQNKILGFLQQIKE